MSKNLLFFAVVCDHWIVNSLDVFIMERTFKNELERMRINCNEGPTNVPNPLVYSFEHRFTASFDDVYEVVIHAWCGSVEVSDDLIKEAFVKSWNTAISDGNTTRCSPFPGTYSRGGIGFFGMFSDNRRSVNSLNHGAGISYFNTTRIILWPDYTQCVYYKVPFRDRPPLSTIEGLEFFNGPIEHSNFRQIIGTRPSPGDISRFFNGVTSTVGELVSTVGPQVREIAINSAEEVTRTAMDVANRVVDVVTEGSSGILPVNRREIGLIGTAAVALGAIGLTAYAVSKLS